MTPDQWAWLTLGVLVGFGGRGVLDTLFSMYHAEYFRRLELQKKRMGEEEA
jgi:hypothetical protein